MHKLNIGGRTKKLHNTRSRTSALQNDIATKHQQSFGENNNRTQNVVKNLRLVDGISQAYKKLLSSACRKSNNFTQTYITTVPRSIILA